MQPLPIRIHSMPERKQYVIVRTDLPWSVRCCQAIHAAVEGMKSSPTSEVFSLVLLRSNDETRLASFAASLSDAGIAVFSWREPDLRDELTAVSFLATTLPDNLDLHLL